MPITGPEAHAYLEAVRGRRRAAARVRAAATRCRDSLGLWRTAGRHAVVACPDDSSDCRRRDPTPPLWADGKVHLYGLRWVRGAPGLTWCSPPSSRRRGTAIAARTPRRGSRYGRGRVVVIPDPDFLRNDVLRRCEWGADVLAMRMLEWLRAGGDEPRDDARLRRVSPGLRRAAVGHRAPSARFLVAHPVGRTILALVAIAGLVLLAASAPRPLPPRDVGARGTPRSRSSRWTRWRTRTSRSARRARSSRGCCAACECRAERGVARGAPALGDDAVPRPTSRPADPALAADVALIARALRETGRRARPSRGRCSRCAGSKTPS